MSLRQAHKSNWHRLAFLMAATFLFFGCSSSSLPSGPKGTVKGTVTYKGNPVPAGSIIVFQNDETALEATGEIQADGTYTLMMQGGNEVPVGKYSISVTPPSDELSEETDMDAYKAMMEGGDAAATTGPFPEKYQSPETSGESCEVKEGENTRDLDMKDGEPAADSPSE